MAGLPKAAAEPLRHASNKGPGTAEEALGFPQIRRKAEQFENALPGEQRPEHPSRNVNQNIAPPPAEGGEVAAALLVREELFFLSGAECRTPNIAFRATDCNCVPRTAESPHNINVAN